MDRIHLGQVPRNSRGHINYKIIPSVMVKVMVAEEELKQLNPEGDEMGCQFR